MGLIRPMVVLVIALLGLCGCERYELEQYYTGKARVRVVVDWMKHFGEKPLGMTIMLAKDGDAITYTDITNDVDSVELNLEPGNYKMLIFNRTSGEFGSMGFAQMKSFDQAFVYAQQQQRVTDFWDVNVAYMREPENIGCAVDTFTVLPDMIDGEFRFVNWKEKTTSVSQTLRVVEVVEPMTTVLNIRIRVKGAKYMSSVIGNISGMADGFLLTQAWRRPQSGYHLLEGWNISPITYEDNDPTKSVCTLSKSIRTFGMPRGRELIEQRVESSNVVSLCFTLLDGSPYIYRWEVGKGIVYGDADLETRADDDNEERREFRKVDITLHLELLLETDDVIPHLPYAQPSGTGAFDADVEPWGDDEIIDIPM